MLNIRMPKKERNGDESNGLVLYQHDIREVFLPILDKPPQALTLRTRHMMWCTNASGLLHNFEAWEQMKLKRWLKTYSNAIVMIWSSALHKSSNTFPVLSNV